MDSLMEVKLASCGNPDSGQCASKHLGEAVGEIFSVSSYTEASRACRSWIEKHNLGGGNWAGGEITVKGVLVGHVSYNGCVWDKDGKVISI